jgi:DnaD/phage-associated family protein
MNKFEGFPARSEFTCIPNVFFSSLLPEITDLAELKTTLHIIAQLYRKKGYPRYVSYNELRGDVVLMGGLRGGEGSPEEALRRGLELAAGRGALLRLRLERDGAVDDIYLLNDEPGRQAVARLESGELKLAGGVSAVTLPVAGEAPPDIFTLYEQNIGILTPMISEQLRDAESSYPADWVRDAIREAVNHGKRKWSYISAILERWATEGKTDGTHQRDLKKTDPDRFIKGKYGHMVQR